jgi:hypothetical protein
MLQHSRHSRIYTIGKAAPRPARRGVEVITSAAGRHLDSGDRLNRGESPCAGGRRWPTILLNKTLTHGQQRSKIRWQKQNSLRSNNQSSKERKI